MILRKKIVFAINQLGIGGAENMIVEQIRCVDREIFEVFLITLFDNPKVNLSNKIASDVIYKQFNFKGSFCGLFDIGSWLKLYKFFSKEKFVAVITNLFISNTIVRLVAILTRVPIILSNELNIYEDKRFWQVITDQILALFTKRIFVSSVDVLEFTSKQENLPKDKFLLNYNAIPLKLAKVKDNRNRILNEFHLSVETLYVVTAGRLIKQKGHAYLIDAVKIMNEKGLSNFKVLIFGQGVMESELKNKIISLGLESQIKIMGLSTMDKILAISDIFVLPSLWEGLSIALLQAMDSGSPIVATDISGSREAIVDGVSGLLVEPGNLEKLATALISLIKDDQLRDKLGVGAKKHVKRFSIESNVKVIEGEILS